MAAFRGAKLCFGRRYREEMKEESRNFRKKFSMFLLLIMFSMAMTLHAQAGTKSVTLTTGQRKQLSVKKTWKKVRWKSSRPGIAAVSSKGKVTAKKAGKAVIIAKSGKKKQKFLVTVKKRQIRVTIGGQSFLLDLENNGTARAFKNLLPAALQMEELNGNEKYFYMNRTLPANAKKPGTIKAGDLMLYGDDCLVLFYETFQSDYSYTKIGHLSSVEGLQDAVGESSVKVAFR